MFLEITAPQHTRKDKKIAATESNLGEISYISGMLSVVKRQDVKASEKTNEQTTCKYVIVHNNGH